MEPLTVPAAVLSLGALASPLLELKWPGRRLASIASSLALAASLGIVLRFLLIPITVIQAAGFRIDALALFFAFVFLTVALIVSLASFDYVLGDPNQGVYYSLILFTTAGMVLLAFANDLVTIFISWELMGLPTFALAAFKKKDPYSSEGAMKFFLVGALSSGIMLYGISLLYLLAGSTSLDRVAFAVTKLTYGNFPIALLALGLLLAGFGFKMALVPFHMWIPDAYEGSPTTVSALLSAGTKKAGFVVAIRALLLALAASPLLRLQWANVLAILALLTMTLGNVAALTQKSLTRMLAYSSIAQAGYIAIGLAIYLPGFPLGIAAALFHVFNHAVMTGAAFVAAAAVAMKLGTASVEGYNGLGSRMPFTSFALTISLLALAGVPPLNGFWSKLFLFSASVQATGQYWWGSWLGAAGFLNSAFSVAYYGWIIKRMYMDEPTDLSKVAEPRTIGVVLAGAVVVIISVGIFPSLVFDLALRVASSLSA